MTQEEYTELNDLVDAVAVQDVHLGRVLSAFASHLPGYSDAAKKASDARAAEAEQAAKEQEAASAAPAPQEPAKVTEAPQAPFAAPVESEQTHAS